MDVVAENGWTMTNLVKGIFYKHDPSLAFVGVHNVLVGPCQVFEAQARLVGNVLTGTVSIASEVEKYEPGQKFESERFFLGLGTEAYIGEISALSGVPTTYVGISAADPSRRHLKMGGADLPPAGAAGKHSRL